MKTYLTAFIVSILVIFSFSAFAEGAQSSASSGIASFLPLLIIIAVFYFMLIRPQSKRNKEQKSLMENLANGDEIVTVGGLLGKITKVGDNFVTLSIADNVEIKVQKHAITSVIPKGSLQAE